jgi:hypothetical protein
MATAQKIVSTPPNRSAAASEYFRSCWGASFDNSLPYVLVGSPYSYSIGNRTVESLGFRPVFLAYRGVPSQQAVSLGPTAQKITEPPLDDITLNAGPSRVFRGSGWNSDASGARVGYRGVSSPGSRDYLIGFRPVFFSYRNVPAQMKVSLMTNVPQTPAAQKISTRPPDRSDRNSSAYRVNHGGSWGNSASFVRVANRDSDGPGGRGYNLGFRPVFFAYRGVPAQTTVSLSTAAAVVAQKISTLPPNRADRNESLYRVRRGGGWDDVVRNARAGTRGGSTPDLYYGSFGFRPVFFAYRGVPAQLAISVQPGRATPTPVRAPVPAPQPVPQYPAVTAPVGGGELSFTAAELTAANQYLPGLGVDSRGQRVYRGGSFYNDTSPTYLSPRGALTQGGIYTSPRLGFRPVITNFSRVAQGGFQRWVPPPPPPPQILPASTDPMWPSLTNYVVKNVKAKMYYSDTTRSGRPTGPMTISDELRKAVLYEVNPSVLIPNSTAANIANITDYNGAFFISLPDEKGYYYLFDHLQTNLGGYGGDLFMITPFGWKKSNEIPIIKRGSADLGYPKTYQSKTYYRQHSSGEYGSRAFKGVGNPTYMGGAVGLAFRHAAAGGYSKVGNRSADAEGFWRLAVQTGLSIEAGGYNYLPLKNCLDSVLMVRNPYDRHGIYANIVSPLDATTYNSAANKRKFAIRGTDLVKLARGEMLARAMFALNADSVRLVYDMIVETGNPQALELFRQRPEIQAAMRSAGLSGLNRLGNLLRNQRRMPPIHPTLAGIIAAAHNPLDG